MPNTRISNLATGGAVAPTDRFVVVETTGVGPVTKTGAQLKDWAGQSFPILTVVQIQSSRFDSVASGGPSFVRTLYGLYTRRSTQPDHAIWIQSADNDYWEWTDEGNGLNVMAAGAVADGGYSFPTTGINTVFTGTDNWQAIQNCIDAHTYFALGGYVYIPSGKFRISKSLQAGYGTEFITSRLKGAGRPYALDIVSGTWLLCDFSNQNGINGHGQRGFVVQDMGLYGLNGGWIQNNGLGGTSALDDTNINNWVDPGLDPNGGFSEFAPYCGIATDPYLGTAPANPYPDVTFPAFMGALGQYGKANASSGMYFENLNIQGFGVGVCNQPNGGVANGDFLSLKNVHIAKCVLGLSIGANQGRSTYRERVVYSQCFTCETTYYQGQGNGKMGGVSVDCSVGQCINLCELDLSFSGQLKYISLYTEAMWRIGTLYAGSGNAGSCEFDTCTLRFDNQNPFRGVPTNVLDGAGQPCLIKFKNCLFHGFPSVLPFNSASFNLSFENTFMNNRQSVTRTATYEYFANNALLGGLVLLQENLNLGDNIRKWRCWLYTLSSGAGFNDIVGPYQVGYTRDYCISAYTRESKAGATKSPSVTVPPFTTFVSAFTLASRTNLEVTFTLDAGWAGLNNTLWNGPLPGDVIITADGTVLFVHSWVSGTRTGIAKMQNNYKTIDGTTYSPITPIEMNNCQIINSRVYTTDFSLQGDIISGSPNITNAGSASTLDIFGEVANGDAYFFDPDVEGAFTPNDTTLSSVSTNSFHIGTAGALYTEARKRLPFFVRQPPANS